MSQPKDYSLWPPERFVLNYAHYGLEVIYEFFRATRLIEKDTLDACENDATIMMIDF